MPLSQPVSQTSSWTPWFSLSLSLVLAICMACLLALPYSERKEPWIGVAVDGTVVPRRPNEPLPPEAVSGAVVLNVDGQRILIPHYDTMSGDAPPPGSKVRKPPHWASLAVDVPAQRNGHTRQEAWSYTWYPSPRVNIMSAFIGLTFIFTLFNCAVAVLLTILARRRRRQSRTP